MVTVGFVVEGDSEKRLVESKLFRKWLRENCNSEVVDPVVNAAGNMCSSNVEDKVRLLKIKGNPDKVVVLADLDPDRRVQCVRERKKNIIGSQDIDIDLVAIARKALESWFLADTEAMCRWLGDCTFYEVAPETLIGMPWDRLKELRDEKGRGPGKNRLIFAKKFIRKHKFDVKRAAQHDQCPSANYFVERLCALGNPRQHKQHKEEEGT